MNKKTKELKEKTQLPGTIGRFHESREALHFRISVVATLSLSMALLQPKDKENEKWYVVTYAVLNCKKNVNIHTEYIFTMFMIRELKHAADMIC